MKSSDWEEVLKYAGWEHRQYKSAFGAPSNPRSGWYRQGLYKTQYLPERRNLNILMDVVEDIEAKTGRQFYIQAFTTHYLVGMGLERVQVEGLFTSDGLVNALLQVLQKVVIPSVIFG
jgi:hypothetical protein